MIECVGVRKVYGRRVVLEGVNLHFGDAGFYLLYGESGSGKTTFLNILAGVTSFEGGSVTVNGRAFTGWADLKGAGADFDYITQDPFFADFLTVGDNLRLITRDEGRVRGTLERFGLGELGDRFPPTLSGGERQRLAVARSYLAGKRVLLLDEPTAALDEDNKRAIFELLRELGREVLVICSSHDAAAREYAGETVAFTKCPDRETAQAVPVPPRPRRGVTGGRRGAGRYLKKWFTSCRRGRSAEVRFFVSLVLAVLLLLLGDLPGHKQDETLDRCFRVNGARFWDFSGDVSAYDTLLSGTGVRKVVLNYSGSCPTNFGTDENGLAVRPPYDTDFNTLPFEAEYFRLADRIEVGGWFTGERQVLLPWEAAEELSPGNHGALVGTTLRRTLYGLGEVELEIVGVLGRLNAFEQGYLKSLELLSDRPFLNSRLTDRLIGDVECFNGGQRTYTLYFDSWADLRAFREAEPELTESLSLGGTALLGSDANAVSALGTVLPVLSALIALFTVLFYTSLITMEIGFNSRFVAAFEYAGYARRRVLSRFIAIHMGRLLVMCALALGLGVGAAGIVNGLNHRFMFLGFQIFSVNGYLTLAFFGGILLLSLAGTELSLRRLKLESWYDTAISQRDLI